MLTNENRKQLEDRVLIRFKECYDKEQSDLASLACQCQTEGEIRAAAGNLVERLLQCVFDEINDSIIDCNKHIISKIGCEDYLTKTIIYKGSKLTNSKIQVDRHIWVGGRRVAFIENKTYLDSCYFDRALADFRKIAQSLHQGGNDPSKFKFIVFAGQNAANNKTLLTYEADFWNDMRHLTPNGNGIVPEIIFFLKGKRSSAKPLYRVKHQIDEDSVRRIAQLALDFIN